MADEKDEALRKAALDFLAAAAKVPNQPQSIPQLSGIVDMARAKAWFEVHWKDPVQCPVCHTDKWTIGAYIAVMHTSHAPNPQAPVLPYIQVQCNECAHTMFFNAVAMGLWAPYNPMQGQTNG
jgi:hypothetical protein